MSNLKVAVIGAGSMGKNHIKTYKAMPGVELVGLYDVIEDVAKTTAEMFNVKAFASLEEVAKNVDAVSVVTTSVTHADVGEFFLNKGIHCLIEKPMATTEEECQRLIIAAERNNATLLVGHIERFNPAVQQMAKILSDTSKIKALTAQRMSYVNGRCADVDVAMDLMIHDMEVVQSLVKSKVVNVEAVSVNKSKDYISALVEFENGVVANLTSSRITQARVRTLTVTTDTNYIDMDFINQSINVHSQGRMPYVNQEEIPEWMNYGLKGSVEQLFIPTNQPLQAEIQHFINCIHGKEKPMTGGQSSLEALRVIWDIQKKLGFFTQTETKQKVA